MTESPQDIVALTMSHNIHAFREAIVSMVQDVGWSETRIRLRDALTTAFGSAWYTNNLIVFNLFDLEELVGYDGDVVDLLDLVPESNDFTDISSSFHRLVIERVKRQVSEGGNTILFDTNKMETQATSTLIPHIAKARRTELERALSVMEANGVFSLEADQPIDQSPLLFTAYGFSVLQNLSWEKPVSRHRRMQEALFYLRELGRDVDVTVPRFSHSSSPPKPEGTIDWAPNMSDRMQQVITASMSLYKGQMDPEDIDTLFSSGFLSCEEVVGYVTDISDKKDHLRGIGSVRNKEMLYPLYMTAVENLINSKSPDRLDLLSKVLDTWFDADSNAYFHRIHEIVLEALSQDMSDLAAEAAMKFLEGVSWKGYTDGCYDNWITLVSTSFHALGMALDIAIEHGKDVFGIFQRFLEGLPWDGQVMLAPIILPRLVKLKGVNAFDDLTGYLIWTHPKLDCRPHVNHGVAEAIISMGPEVVPKLKKHLQYHDFRQAVVDVLDKLGLDIT